ncbi:MAG: 2-C-methyl-D-erythritol 4-phosphate cytidylyltransferase [Lachnospiraceae bacterium]|nr:2-C-methyl-D-erythritol 4-phosphate cytidylyltransferase [Lachnospiraceae bacterium]
MEHKKYAAIVLSAGKGSRMHSTVPKQYLMLEGKPVLYYSLMAFQQSMVEDIVLVTQREDIHFCQSEIVGKYGITKVSAVIEGGQERYHSVFLGLRELGRQEPPPDYVLIHDGARPFVDGEVITRCAEGAKGYQACVAAMPAKDTVKIADEQFFAKETPERKNVWQVQTPQAFSFPLIYQAYGELLNRMAQGEPLAVTDDAMVLEVVRSQKVKLVEGSYRNIKITTQEDFLIAKALCEKN